jgi:Chromo (CHRromatin Organisation MOdifier) domain
MVKPEQQASTGLLQPLPILTDAWTSIGIDFITGLLKSDGKEVIMVIVDGLTKYVHFIPLSHPYTVWDIPQAFFDNIYKLHGFPTSIISDRDPVFTSNFWRELMKLLGVQLNMSSMYHPQIDGHTKHVNQCLETYLRIMLLDEPKRWTKWLPLAQWWYNSNFHRSIQTTYFQALYGFPPPQLSLGHPPRSNIEAVDSFLRDRHRIITQLKENLVHAKNRMKKFADQHRTERHFDKGDWVYLKLQPYRHISISRDNNQKLAPRFYGPFEIEDRIGKVAYQLRLPLDSAIHPVLHVSQLKKHISRDTIVSPTLPILNSEGALQNFSEYVLACRAIKWHNEDIPQILVKWTNLSEAHASWEDYELIKQCYPTALLEDKKDLEEEAVLDNGELGALEEKGVQQRLKGFKLSGRSVSSNGQHSINRRSADKGAHNSNTLSEDAQLDLLIKRRKFTFPVNSS